MSRATNTANLGAKLQNTTGNELSGGGNIRAVTFQGSGRLLTDILTLTGGRITIPVGSTRQYKNLYTAFNSISSLLFDDDATVNFQLDPEVIIEPSYVDLTHPSGNVISISGTSVPFMSREGSPILGVSGSNTVALSAEVFLDSVNSSIPNVGDFVLIPSASGRTVGTTNSWKISADQIFITYSYTNTDIVSSLFVTNPDLEPLRPNDVLIFSKLGAGGWGAAQHVVMRMKDYFNQTVNATYTNDKVLRLTTSNPSIIEGSTPTRTVITVGNPASYRGTTFSQTGTTLTFSDAANTNTYLNVGDEIWAMGQSRQVMTVAANNTCTINGRFLDTYNGGGYNASLAGVPFLIKTAYDRYVGLHKVVAVNPSLPSATLEIVDPGFSNSSMGGQPAAPNIPLPVYGVGSIGRIVPTAQGIMTNTLRGETQASQSRSATPAGRILKSVLNFDSITLTQPPYSCIIVNNDLKIIDNLVIRRYNFNAFPRSFALNVAFSKICSLQAGTFECGVGIYGTNRGVVVNSGGLINIVNFHITSFNYSWGTYDPNATYTDARSAESSGLFANTAGAILQAFLVSVRSPWTIIQADTGSIYQFNVQSYNSTLGSTGTTSQVNFVRGVYRTVSGYIYSAVFSQISWTKRATALSSDGYGGLFFYDFTLVHSSIVNHLADAGYFGLLLGGFGKNGRNIINGCVFSAAEGQFWSPHPGKAFIDACYFSGFGPVFRSYYDETDLNIGTSYSGPNRNNIFYCNDSVFVNQGYRYQNFYFNSTNYFISNNQLCVAPGTGQNGNIIVTGGGRLYNTSVYTGTAPTGPNAGGNGFAVANGNYFEGF